jgi:hypothetical protein
VWKYLCLTLTNLEYSEKYGKSLFQGDGYSNAIIESIEKVKKQAIEINQEAIICEGERLRKMDDTIQVQGHNLLIQSKDIRVQGQDIQQIKKTFENIYQFLLANPHIDPHSRQPSQLSKYPRYMSFGETLTARPSVQEANPPRTQQKPKRIAKKAYIPKESLASSQLVAQLNYDPSVPEADTTRCRLSSNQMSLSSKDRISHIAHSNHVQHWLLDPQNSAALLIMGNMPDTTSLTSPLSFFVAELATLYSHADSTFTLSYFCGLHIDSWKDPLANAAGLILSLLGQLLSTTINNDRFDFEFDLGFIDDEVIEQLQNYDLETLCEVFKTLVLQIKETIVLFCFLDTVSIYEIRERRDGTRFVLSMLRELVDETGRLRMEGNSGVVFKLLVTDPGAVCVVEEFFADEEKFLVPEFIDGGNQGVVLMEGLDPGS